jgi:hypothetical protein
MKADRILKKHEDENEMHFHEVDREWIIEAMEDYASLRQFNIGYTCEDCKQNTIDSNYRKYLELNKNVIGYD